MDPQLVDPHTYPDRPWPLSSLTVLYTDLYLRRSYRLLQERLQPDATLFLGDLFDGGREWGTPASSSPEQRYKKYGSRFWLKEYIRFSNIFLRSWFTGSSVSPAEPTGRRLLASLPGNHDLGFAAGIQMPVKERFDAYFGPLNRIDIIGNHSFVHLDTVSLSAMDQIDPKTGSSGAGDGSAAATASTKIWTPVEDFLAEAKTIRAKAIRHTCETRFSWKSPSPRSLVPEVRQAEQAEASKSSQNSLYPVSSSQFPTIILSHVPLYRSGEANCGPLRERGSAIPLQAGYQYQNVLTPLISHDIVKHLTAEEITMIYSGDDHDYCEIEHNEFTGRIREITVKSMSWAMGIRKPGVQLVSLWNPVDVEKAMSDDPNLSTPRDTVQNHMCLLPDQLSIFIRYGQAAGLTLFLLLLSALRYNPSTAATAHAATLLQHEKSDPLLPTSELSRRHESSNSKSSCVQSGGTSHLSTRKPGYGHIPASSRTASRSPVPSKPPYIDHARNAYHLGTEDVSGVNDHDHDHEDDWGMPKRVVAMARRRNFPPATRLAYLRREVGRTVWPALAVYMWLLWHG
ncbi:putative calcineurin-like phosphoesterase [Cladophialophora carrionii]|uniref:Putative calcineurin-like phosphoesterase n=1 Tax=Cladophialophora carrionii TaxID=86049 RepID=A0A1C1CLE8_9EURO|nr:putative calcineurin-like phosphoesterase [Cladophialophora carrionii]